MTRELRLGPLQLVGATLWDDGESMTQGPAIGPLTIALADLKGSKIYDSLIEQWPTLKAQAEAQDVEDAPVPNRTQRRAKTNGKASP